MAFVNLGVKVNPDFIYVPPATPLPSFTEITAVSYSFRKELTFAENVINTGADSQNFSKIIDEIETDIHPIVQGDFNTAGKTVESLIEVESISQQALPFSSGADADYKVSVLVFVNVF